MRVDLIFHFLFMISKWDLLFIIKSLNWQVEVGQCLSDMKKSMRFMYQQMHPAVVLLLSPFTK